VTAVDNESIDRGAASVQGARVTAGARISGVFRAVVWLTQLALVLLLLQSSFWSGQVPWSLKLVVGGTAILAAFRPADALLVVAGLVPLGYAMVTRIWNAYPFGLSEALALAFLAGYLWHRRPGAAACSPAGDRLTLPAYLLGLIVVASCLVQIAVLQFRHDYPLPYARDFIRFLATGYLTTVPDWRPSVDGRGFVTTGAVLIEGVALMLCARTLCRRQPALARRLTTVVVAAGVGVAALTIYQVWAGVLGSHQSLLAVIGEKRWSSPAIPSLLTVGGYLMLVAFVAAGTAIASRARGLMGWLATGVCLAAMWLSQTRSAMVAGLTTVVAGGAWPLFGRLSKRRVLPTLLLAGTVAVAVGAALVAYNPLGILRPRAGASLGFRLQAVQTALRMMETRPLFGVGVGRYWDLSNRFASAALLDAYTNSHAHNMFLWLGAELGLVGLGVFLWILAAAAASIWPRLRTERSDFWFLGLCAGLAAFIITWLAWQVMYPQAAFTFWILVGVTVAGAARGAGETLARSGWSRLRTIGVAVLIAAVVVSVPLRARREIAEVNPNGITYGFYNWNRDAASIPFRWTRPRAAFLLRSAVQRVEVPISAAGRPSGRPVDVEFVVDDRPADRMTLDDDEWHRMVLSVPPDAQDVWKVEIRVSPAWVPSQTMADSSDDRELGVRVGEIVITMNGEEIVLR